MESPGGESRQMDPVGTITEITHPEITAPRLLATDWDRNLWFTMSDAVGRIMPEAIQSFTSPSLDSLGGITAGPDGHVWFTDSRSDLIGQVAMDGTIDTHTDSTIERPRRIALGSDGNLWFTNSGPSRGDPSIVRITPGGTVTAFTDPALEDPWGIVAGPDGNLWVADSPAHAIGRMTTAGDLTMFSTADGSRPENLTPAPDGGVWFTAPLEDRIGRIDMDGSIVTYSDPALDFPEMITQAPDGNLWFTQFANDSIGHITVDGGVSTLTDPTVSEPSGIASGAFGVVWFGNAGSESIGQVQVLGPSTFPDVSDFHPFRTEIEWLVNWELSTGFPDGTFQGPRPVTRQAVAAFLHRLAGEPEPAPGAPTFSDVGPGHPFAEAITWLAGEGITVGFDDGTFRPTGEITRQAMAAFLHRLAGEPPPATAPGVFPDVGAGHPFAEPIAWLSSWQITTGFADGTFRPTDEVTRQAMAAFVYRYVDRSQPFRH